MNKFRSTIIGSVMTIMAIPVAFAAGTPSLNIPTTENTQQSVTFNNISNDVKNLQVTINLSKEQKYEFSINEDIKDKDGVEFCYKSQGSSITIYITSNTYSLTNSDFIKLGDISADENFNIISATDIKLVNDDNTSSVWEDIIPPSDDTNDNTNNGDNNNSNNNNNNNQNNNSNSGNNNSSGNTSNNNNSNNSGNTSNNNTSNNNTSSNNTSSNNTSSNTNSNNNSSNNSNNNNNSSNDTDESTQVTLPFTDVNENDWYYSAVKYVYDNGLMSGISNTTFAPNANTTRGMIVTVLYRLENQPNVNIDNSFNDVKVSDYYGNAIYWAKQNNIVTGYNSTTFAPNDNITREQMATILYRYAVYKGYTVNKTTDLSSFSDEANINSYALTPIKWAVASNIISGMGDGTISPLGNASRAQIATILMRFIENL